MVVSMSIISHWRALVLKKGLLWCQELDVNVDSSGLNASKGLWISGPAKDTFH